MHKYFSINPIKYRKKMLRFKEKVLDFIDIPITIGNIRRILRFHLDKKWIFLIRESLEKKGKK